MLPRGSRHGSPISLSPLDNGFNLVLARQGFAKQVTSCLHATKLTRSFDILFILPYSSVFVYYIWIYDIRAQDFTLTAAGHVSWMFSARKTLFVCPSHATWCATTFKDSASCLLPLSTGPERFFAPMTEHGPVTASLLFVRSLARRGSRRLA